jgi:UPF0755 protein
MPKPEDEEFWGRSGRTRREDRRSRRRNGRQETSDRGWNEPGARQPPATRPGTGSTPAVPPPPPPPPRRSQPPRPPSGPQPSGPQPAAHPKRSDATRRSAQLTPWSNPTVSATTPPQRSSSAAPTGSGGSPGWGHGIPPSSAPQQHLRTYGGVEGGVGSDIGDDVYDDAGIDDGDEDLSRRRGCTRLAIVMGVLAAVFCVVLVAAGLWVNRQINPSGGSGEPVTVELVSGQSTAEIAQVLEDHGVITSARVFTVYAWARGSGDIQAGTYDLHTNMAMGDVMDVLSEGPELEPLPEGRAVTIPEGLTVEETIERLTDSDDGVPGFDADTLRFLVADGSVRSRHVADEQGNIEGTLFPETYTIVEGVTELEFLERMVTEFETVFNELQVEERASQVNLSPYEVLIVASLIEKETRIDDERPMVARVIYNRLDEGMALQIDATSCYEIDDVPCRLSAEDLERDSPYNTRINTGLPPTPIASPGRDSIEAALSPADGDWLYYVRNDDEGGHLFTADYDEFVQARQTCIEQDWGCR